MFILGQVIGGALRGMYAAGVILLITLPIAGSLVFNGWSFLIMFLNGTVFATIALVLSFLAKSYTDAPRFTAYIITPMSFLCNTFFSTESMPPGIRQVIAALPLSQACEMIRSIAGGGEWKNDCCPRCGHTGTMYCPGTGVSRCGKCGLTW